VEDNWQRAIAVASKKNQMELTPMH